MAKRLFYAQVEMKIIRQVEFEADEVASDSVLDDLAIAQAEQEYGKCGEYEIVELDYRF